MRKLNVIGLHNLFLNEHGFRFNLAKMAFTKNFSEGQQVVLVDFVKYPDESYLEYRIGTRINAVEELIQKFIPAISDHFERSITLLLKPSDISETIPERFAVTNEEEIHQAIKKIEEFFLNYGFDWLDQMSYPEVLEDYFARSKEQIFQSNHSVYNSFRGAVLAKLYNPEDYPVLKQVYLEQIQTNTMTPFSIASFLQLLDYLEKMEINISS
ncbi:hypothetical protein DFQ04_0890 [Algoriphagus boseongensis]|uniref:Uncharacterized protein n=2 Tax=Algoriphagus boseongensis TaxID=1442587 RepID=A0A4R6TA44_9BACT|nr:hypothetical protein DFQ04_0890 [Algoriphagus boseongensis]